PEYHPGLNSTKCVITCKDLTKIKEDAEIVDCLRDQQVIDVRRITRRTSEGREPTATVILTVSGTTRPEHVDIGYQRVKTRPYYPAPMMCYQCFEFGHTKARCKHENATCGNCGDTHTLAEGERCTKPAYCTRCKSNDHPVGSRRCPSYQEEDHIQHIRIDKGISYREARSIFEANTGTRSYAGVTANSKNQAIIDLAAQVEKLNGLMAIKDAQIKSLQSQATSSSNTRPNDDYEKLLNLVTKLQADVELKDKRIQMLEDANKLENRIDQVRKHGTIEDLIARVSTLESTSSQKDREIEALQKENKKYRDMLGFKEPKPQRQKAPKEKPSELPKDTPLPYQVTKPNKATETTEPKPKGAKPKLKKVLSNTGEPDSKRTRDGNSTTTLVSNNDENTKDKSAYEDKNIFNISDDEMYEVAETEEQL
ncbi:uncharacterized protein LOC134284394, partial [Aedes albopictus]|uniref:Uncharacterized protein n=1 Tax=Aedes albopictus TaxID=7160 RepID=A0ABM1Z2X4_AEDAL